VKTLVGVGRLVGNMVANGEKMDKKALKKTVTIYDV